MTLNEHLATLPALRNDGMPEEPQRLIARLATDLETTEARDLDTTIDPCDRAAHLELRARRRRRAISCDAAGVSGQRLEQPRVIYDIRHLTAYSYDAPVTSASLALRLTPRDSADAAQPRARDQDFARAGIGHVATRFLRQCGRTS